jgi:hypothetical protein
MKGKSYAGRSGLGGRHLLAAMTLGAAVVSLSGRAFGTALFDPNGTGTYLSTPLQNLDWAPGSLLSQNGVTAVNNFVAGSGSTTFFDYYQAKLGTYGLTDGTIATMPFTGSANPGQLSIVVGMTEQVIGVSGSPGGTGASAQFNWLSGPKNWLEVYFNPNSTGTAAGQTPTLNDSVVGTNFNQGKLILRAQITSVNSTIFTVDSGGSSGGALDQDATGDWYRNKNTGTTEITTIQGHGSTTITATLGDTASSFYGWDPNYFSFTGVNNFINLTFVQNVGLDSPFLSTPPSSGFVDTPNTGAMDTAGPSPNLNIGPGTTPGTGVNSGTDGPNTVGTDNGVSGPDIIFQTDTNETFAQDSPPPPGVPEPLTASLAGFGLAGLGLTLVRRRRSA